MTKQSKPALETAKLKATRSKARNSEAVTSETGQSKNTIGRRSVLAAAVAGAGLTFFGPWKHNRVWAASQKPILMGLTHDASGFLAASGAAEKRGTIMAIEEANARGGVLGRNIEYVWMDTESTPATASRVAERMITRDEVSFIVGAFFLVPPTRSRRLPRSTAASTSTPIPARRPSQARTVIARNLSGTEAARTLRAPRRATRLAPSARTGCCSQMTSSGVTIRPRRRGIFSTALGLV